MQESDVDELQDLCSYSFTQKKKTLTGYLYGMLGMLRSLHLTLKKVTELRKLRFPF